MATRRLRIMLDLDGVCYKFERTARYMLRLYRGVSVEESQHWDYIKDHCSPEDWEWLWTEGVKLGLFRHGHLYKGTIEAVAELAKLGDIVVITSRPKSAVQDTLDFLSYHRLPVSEVHILGPDTPKSSVPHCDVYVDDSSSNAADLLRNTDGLVLLWDRPWNQHIVPVGVYKVELWSDVLAHVRELKEERAA